MTLKDILKSKKMTQEKLVQKMKKHHCFKYQQQISDWLNGRRAPDAFSIFVLSQVLDCTADEIIRAYLEPMNQTDTA